MALVGIELETLVSESDARFHKYEYTMSEIFITCGT